MRIEYANWAYELGVGVISAPGAEYVLVYPPF